MFTVETFKVKGSPDAVGRKMIKAQLGNKAKILGSGSYGSVWGTKESDVVFKIGNANDNDGYLAYVDVLAKQTTANPFLPKIYGVRYIKSADGSQVFVVAMEKLKPMNRNANPVVDFFDEELGNRRSSDRSDGEKLLGVKKVYPKPLKAALEVLRKAHKAAEKRNRWGCDWDLHSGNFMMRGNQVVVTDPLA